MRICFLPIAAALGLSALQLQAALKVVSDFENGSARVLAVNPDTQEIRISPAGDLKRGMPNWWSLRVDGVDPGKPLVLEVVALEVGIPAEGNSEGKTVPLNPGWTLPARAAISTNGTDWAQTAPGKRNGNRSVYRVPPGSSTVWLAWGPPFTPRDAAAFAERMARACPFAKGFTLTNSLEGRAVPGLEIRDGTRPASERPAVWITGRQHAWEVGGSWVAVGFAEWTASDDARAQWLRRNAEIFIVPVMDVDHVATGDGGKHARPRDHNRDWSDAPHWPEVAAAQQRMLALAKEGRLAVFFDLHNPSGGQKNEMFYVQYPPYVGARAAALQERFIALARAEFGELVLTDGKPSVPEHLPIWKRISAPWVCEHGNPHTISFTVETPWNTPQGTPEGYREVGRKLGRAVEQYLRGKTE